MLKDAVNEYAYNAEIAGISYNIAISVYGIKVRGKEEGEEGKDDKPARRGMKLK